MTSGRGSWSTGPPPSGTATRDGNDFQKTLDISTWDPGFYCFAFNPGPNAGYRVTQEFYVVDDYLVVDASIDDPLDTYAPDTRKPDYSVSGLIAGYGTDAVGTLTVRFHNPKVTCWIDASTGTWRTGDTGFDADAIDDYAGVDGADFTCNDGTTGTFARTCSSSTPPPRPSSLTGPAGRSSSTRTATARRSVPTT